MSLCIKMELILVKRVTNRSNLHVKITLLTNSSVICYTRCSAHKLVNKSDVTEHDARYVGH